MSSTLPMAISPVFIRNARSEKLIRANQGGTGSGKTYSILQLLICLCMGWLKSPIWEAIKVKHPEKANKPLTISVCSVTLPHLKKGAIKDFIDLMNMYNLYDERLHNKTDQVYHMPNGSIEFFSLDTPKKARGLRRTMLYVNEVDLIDPEQWRQLLLRTDADIFCDYNPADEFSWVYDDILLRADVELIISTYLDNIDFLPDSVIKEIERYKLIDPNFWRVYGLGQRGKNEAIIYSNWDVVDSMPKDFDEEKGGMDFGYTNPSTMLHGKRKEIDGVIHWWIDQVIYQSHLTNPDIVQLLNDAKVDKNLEIFADPNRPDTIDEIYDGGYNIKKATKDVEEGIKKVQECKIHITKRSVETIKEFRSYKWMQDRNGRILPKPVKINDHATDTVRYMIYSEAVEPKYRGSKFTTSIMNR